MIPKKPPLPRFSTSDRKLGDEWKNWGGEIDSETLGSPAGKRTFMGVLLLVWLSLGGFGALVCYLIAPRLAQFYTALPLMLLLVLAAIWMVLGLWFLLMALSLWTGKDFLVHFKSKTLSLTFLIPIAFRMGHRIGISKDKLSNSFVRVSNLLIKTRVRKVRSEDLMILLPRCLTPALLKRINAVAKSLNIQAFTVSGGSKARALLQEHRPKALIGVACERDLLSGLQDVLDYLPVIGLPNRRPHGPCKDTEIDWDEFERALITFLGRDDEIHALCALPKPDSP